MYLSTSKTVVSVVRMYLSTSKTVVFVTGSDVPVFFQNSCLRGSDVPVYFQNSCLGCPNVPVYFENSCLRGPDVPVYIQTVVSVARMYLSTSKQLSPWSTSKVLKLALRISGYYHAESKYIYPSRTLSLLRSALCILMSNENAPLFTVDVLNFEINRSRQTTQYIHV